MDRLFVDTWGWLALRDHGTSMVVMLELGLRRVLTEDRHFSQVGMGFERVP